MSKANIEKEQLNIENKSIQNSLLEKSKIEQNYAQKVNQLLDQVPDDISELNRSQLFNNTDFQMLKQECEKHIDLIEAK